VSIHERRGTGPPRRRGPPAGQRPVCVLTKDAAVEVLLAVMCAPITRTVRGIRSEVPVGYDEGLPEPSVVNCDNLVTVPKLYFDAQPVGSLGVDKRAELDRALRYALDIRYRRSAGAVPPSSARPASRCQAPCWCAPRAGRRTAGATQSRRACTSPPSNRARNSQPVRLKP